MWNIFEQSSQEDETITNAFSSRGIYNISSDELIKRYPKVQASVQNKKMVIAIDQSIVLLENEMVAKCSFLNFNAQIDVMAISNSGNLIVCGLSDGEIHGIFIKGIPLFNLSVRVDDVHMTGRTFAGVQQIANRFFFTCTNGSVYQLSEIDETPLVNNLNISINDNETVSFNESILEGVTVTQFLTSKRNLSELNAAALIQQTGCKEEEYSNKLLFIGGNNNALLFRNKSDDFCRFAVPEVYAGIKSIYDLENLILVLTNSGHVLEVCPLTKMLIYSEINVDQLIDEIIIMECNDDNIELLILTKVNSGERLMRIIEYPSFKCISELDLKAHSWLVHQPKCSVNLYYLDGDNINEEDIPTLIEMKLVSETQPSERFKKLIAKGHLEEAEIFGNQFELSLQPIYEAKAKRIILEMYSLNDNNEGCLNKRFEDLCSLMVKIESKDFFKNNRMIPMPSRTVLAKYLQEVLKHLDEQTDEYDIMEILEQQLRLETLSLIDPYECNMDWQKFIYNSNLVKTITSLFKTDILTACLIWKRHSSSLMPHLNEQELRKLLNLVPNKVDAFCIVQWLRQFVPTVANTHPYLMPYITEWSIQRTRSLQHSEHWPEIGLEFSTKVADIFEELQFLHSDVRRQHERNIAKLRDLVNALQDLSVLKTSYNLISTLDNYLQDSIDETALYILQRVHLDNLKSLVNDFLYVIFQEKGKSPVAAIRQYINLLVLNRSSFSSWLARAVACIQLLHNEDDRLESALLVLQSSPVPWPDTVAPLIKMRYSTHPLASKINTEYEIQFIKIMKVKYGWPAESSSDSNLNLFMLRVVKMDLPDMLSDLQVLTSAAPEISASAHFYCCYQLVRRGKLEMAYEFFKQLQMEKSSISSLFADMLENLGLLKDEKSIEEHTQMIEFYKLITTQPMTNFSTKRLRSIQNRFVLQQKFGLCIDSINDILPYQNRKKLLDNGIEKIIERSQATVNITGFLVSEICELSQAVSMGKLVGAKRVCERLPCLPLSCALAYAMLELDDCTTENKEDFIDFALVLIAQQITVSKKSSVSKGSLNNTDPLAFLLAYDLLVRTLKFEQKQPHGVVELLKFIHIVMQTYPNDAVHNHYNANESEINKDVLKALDALKVSVEDSTLSFLDDINGSFDLKPKSEKRQSVSLFDDIEVQSKQQPKNKPSTVHQVSIVEFVSRTLLLMLLESDTQNELLVKIRNHLSDEIKNDIDGARENFFLSLEYLGNAKMHNVWYTMAQYLLDFQKHCNCRIINSDFVSLQLLKVLRNVMTHTEVNFIDLFVMLIADNHSSTLLENLSNNLKTDQQKVNFLTLSEMYSVHFEEKERISSIRINRLKQYYYMEFCKLDPSVKNKFNAEIDNIELLLKEIHSKNLDVKLLERMSRDFGLDFQQMLVAHVLSILRSQELQFEIKTDSFGEEELVMTSSVEEIYNLCQPYLNAIKNTELLVSKLQPFVKEINIYFYELYLCVIEMLSFIDAGPKEMQVWTSILHFLKHKMITRRRNRPEQMETDIWLKSQGEMGVMPKISRYRLPFLPIVEYPLKDILENEISVDNCETWFPLIQMHTVLKGSIDSGKLCDYFCMKAVRNSISAYKVKNHSETWQIQPTNNAFLKSVLRLVQHVQNPSNAFMILYFAMNYAPEGADHVEAAYECYKYAIANEALFSDTNMKDTLLKIKRKYPILKTQHLLYLYGLVDENLMRLVENPERLIFNLYHHEIILKASKLDINAVVTEIAQLHELDVDALQFQLLQIWLSFTSETTDGTVLEETFLEDQNFVESNGAAPSNTADNVVRANYILNSWPKQKAIQFLVAHIFPSDGSVNTSKQLKMYECFSKLNDGSPQFSNVLSQRQYITIKCVHELKQLGYNSSLDKFLNCDKINILKTIWQRNADNSHTLEILANICLGFEIYVPKIWNGILKRMAKFNMVRELNALVDVLSCKPQLLHIEGLTIAWDCVLKTPFKKADQTRSFEQEEQLNKCLFRLQSCPVIHKLNLFEFAEQCFRLDRPHMAAILIAFCKNDNQRSNIKKLIENCKNEKLRKEIMDLEDAGILPIIINVSLKELDL